MIVKKNEIKTITLQLSIDELKIFKNALNVVCHVIPQSHLDLRLEITSENATDLSSYITNKLSEVNRLNDSNEIQVTLNELRALKNCLNEVCHGIKLVDFEEKLEFSREQVKILFNEVWEGLREVLKFLHDSSKQAENSNGRNSNLEFG